MNGDSVQSMMVALPVATAGVMLATAGGMLRATRPQVRWIGVVFALAVAAYAIKHWNDEVHVLPDFVVFLRLLLGAGAVGWFWLFVMALFEDSRIRHSRFAAVGGLVLLCVAATYASEPYRTWLWLLSYSVQIVMALLALAIVVRGWKGDLVEARRRLRGPFLVAVAGYILAMRSADILEVFGIAPGWIPVANAVVRFAVCLAGSLVSAPALAPSTTMPTETAMATPPASTAPRKPISGGCKRSWPHTKSGARKASPSPAWP
jgi:hypothetical protein